MRGKLDRQVGMDFLMVELRSGLTFADLAKSEDPHEVVKIARNIQNARKAYQTIQRLRDRVDLNERANAKLDEGLKKLEDALESLEHPRKP